MFCPRADDGSLEEDVEVVGPPTVVTHRGYRESGGKATSIIGMIRKSPIVEEWEGSAEHNISIDMFLSKILKAQEWHQCFPSGKWFF